ncbi:5-formyltetrahydrofolate cyclo-ligase [Chitinophagaceae bacterium IBVUCB2]|nr:5-formyltetrahydrofolate cyclo-ligase [Chitinophagaceae bacterium IBVUCB2]
MTKKELRKIYREKRNTLTTPERSRLDDLLLIQLQTVNLPFINILFSYWPIEANKEPNTHLFTDYIEFRNPELVIAYPKSDFTSNEMRAVVVTEETAFNRNSYCIYEPVEGASVDPEEIDMILVPLLAVDKNGYRVGYGKGFYDKFLSNCRKECIKAGFSYFEPIEQISDREDFDVPLDLCITPQNVYVF